MMRYIGLGISTLGVSAIILEAYSGKVFFSSVLLALALLIIGIYIYVKNLRVKFPDKDENGMKKMRVVEDIPLETTPDLDHLNSVQNAIKNMKKHDEIYFELATLMGKQDQIKITNANGETLGIIPYTYPHRKHLSARIDDGATTLGKVFNVSRTLTGKFKISITVAQYMINAN